MVGKRAMTGAMTLLMLLGGAPASAGDPAAGARKSGQCVACHGEAGVSTNPLFPHLAGQRAGYLQLQLEAFRTGERYHPLMTPVAQALTVEDMSDLATYFSSVGPLADAGQVSGDIP